MDKLTFGIKPIKTDLSPETKKAKTQIITEITWMLFASMQNEKLVRFLETSWNRNPAKQQESEAKHNLVVFFSSGAKYLYYKLKK